MRHTCIAACLLSGADALAQQAASPAYYNPSVPPDGRTLILESTRDGTYALLTADLNGGQLTRISDPARARPSRNAR
jgi:hypothetical protein